MKYKIIILHQAALDFKEGKKWYRDTLVNGLSQRFSNAVKGTILNLQNHPTAYAIRYKKVRIAHTDKFSYAIHFFMDNNKIVIIAIIYSGRDPKITNERIY